MVVNGKEGKEPSIGGGSLVFSPDSKHIAFVASSGERLAVVLDEVEGQPYDLIVTKGGGVVFDSPTSFHYLVLKGDAFYVVEEVIQ